MPEMLLLANSAAHALASPLRTVSPRSLSEMAVAQVRQQTAVVRQAPREGLVRVRALAASGRIALKLAQKR